MTLYTAFERLFNAFEEWKKLELEKEGRNDDVGKCPYCKQLFSLKTAREMMNK